MPTVGRRLFWHSKGIHSERNLANNDYMNDPSPSSTISVDNLIPLAVGAQLQEFVVERVVGIGGFGIVYQAHDSLLRRTVAIKEYMPTSMAARGDGATVSLRSSSHSQDFETGKAGFIDEARMLAQFKHPALIEVFRFWEQNSTAYMATPFYEGRTLKQRLRDTPGIPDEAVLKKILLPVLDALEHMHLAQVYHRDISPDNIMVLTDGRPILLDLGAARRLETENAQALTVLVKPGYAPIEQYAGDAAVQQGPWTDIYGWGASAYFALTGKPPPPSASRIMSDSIIKLADANIADYSNDFLAAIDAALAVRPDDRPQSIAALKSLFTVETVSVGAKADAPVALAVEIDSDLEKTILFEATRQHDRATASVVPTSVASVPPKKSSALLVGGAVCVALLVGAFWWFAQTPAPVATVVKNEAPKVEVPKVEVPKVEVAKVEVAKVEEPAPASAPEPTTAVALSEIPKVMEPPKADPVMSDKPAIARLSIKPWGEILVNGETKGVSPPLKALSLAPGDYNVEIRNGDYPPHKISIKLKSGEVFKLNHAFVDAAQK
jgi:serine/threonine protein kinase